MIAFAVIRDFIHFIMKVHQEIVEHRQKLIDIIAVKEDGFIDKFNKLLNEIENTKIGLTYVDSTKDFQNADVRVFFGEQMRYIIEKSRNSPSWRFMSDDYPKIKLILYDSEKTEFSKILEISEKLKTRHV